jgi:predicted Zn finger-like uncharacterized protein
MLLATQCPHCFTSFRVANDQLKLHAGLVRCGACQQTFNGIEYLLAPGAKPAVPPAVAPAIAARPVVTEPLTHTAPPETFTPVQVAIPEVAFIAEPDIVAPFDIVENASIPSDAARSNQDQNQGERFNIMSSSLEFDLGDDAPAPTIVEAEINVESEFESSSDVVDNSHADLLKPISLISEENNDRTAVEFQTEQTRSEQKLDLIDNAEADASIEEEKAEETVDAEKPDFVIQAEKKQRRSRLVRVSMIILSTLLFFALLAQATYSLRNQISAWFPQSKPVLQEACKFLRCRIELPTQIEVISIESNELQALSGDKNIFSLAIQLQNKSTTLQAWPMLELILNDAKDKPVLQRVFTPADYLANKNDLIKGFGANSEQTIKLYFELSGPKASGYHVGVFYP